jgi:hypothetical protein
MLHSSVHLLVTFATIPTQLLCAGQEFICIRRLLLISGKSFVHDWRIRSDGVRFAYTIFLPYLLECFLFYAHCKTAKITFRRII